MFVLFLSPVVFQSTLNVSHCATRIRLQMLVLIETVIAKTDQMKWLKRSKASDAMDKWSAVIFHVYFCHHLQTPQYLVAW